MKAKDVTEVNTNPPPQKKKDGKKYLVNFTEYLVCSLTSKDRHGITMIWDNEKVIEGAQPVYFFHFILAEDAV